MKTSSTLCLSALIAISLCSLSACNILFGEEIARLEIKELSVEGTYHEDSTTVQLKEGDEITIWTDVDLEYEGEVDYLFKAYIESPGKKKTYFTIYPEERSTTVGEVTTSFNNHTSTKYQGKAETVVITEGGTYTLRGYFITDSPDVLTVNKSDLVIKK